MFRAHPFCLVSVAILVLTPHSPSWAQPVPGAVQHVVQISLDGLGATFLQFYLTNAPEQFPNFVRLTREGAFTLNARCDYHVSETVPNHATMFTGRPVLQPAGFPDTVHHGYNNNFPGANDTFHLSGNPEVPYKASFFDVAHDHGLSTVFYASKTRLTICDRSYNETHGAPDTIDEDNGRDKIDQALLNNGAITALFDALTSDLTNAPRHYTFLHCTEPDTTGHATGWGSMAWSNAVRAVDVQLGRVLSAIAANPAISNRTALIITADHGGGGVDLRGHTEAYHFKNYTIPLFVWGPGIGGGLDAYSLFSNRADPGTNRVDYTVDPQPLRDGDAANIGLALLGLPPIPGSFMMPVFGSMTPRLAIQHSNPGHVITWAGAAGAYRLESSTDPANTNSWSLILTAIQSSEGTNTYVAPEPGEPQRFFRLRRN